MDFKTDLERGKQGELMVAQAFEKMGYEVKDVTDDPSFWKKDVDFIINDNGVERRLEVKTDWNIWRTGNVVLELNKTYDPKILGWFNFSQATHFAFVDIKNRLAYMVRANELAARVNEKKDTLRKKQLNNYDCYLLNIQENSDIFTAIAI